MCNLYSHVKGPEAIRDLANEMGGDWLDRAGNLEPQLAIFPDAVAPVVRSRPEGGRELIKMRWGFPIPPPKPGEKKKNGWQTNIRNPNWSLWLPWMEVGHCCLVRASSFSEYDWRTRPPTVTWFAVDDTRPLFFFAGVWMPWSGLRGTKANPADDDHLLYSFLTTKPNGIVAPVQPKAMPVLLLDRAARETWLTGSIEEALGLQKPAPDSAVKIVATGPRQDG